MIALVGGDLLPMARAHQKALEERLGTAFRQLEAGLEELLKHTK